MTEEQKLKLAAKAAGYQPVRMADDGKALMLYGVQEQWNPRTDNGQSFELAMLAGITVRSIFPYMYALGKNQHQVRFDDSGDMMAAAREAVFMAAVELGRSAP